MCITRHQFRAYRDTWRRHLTSTKQLSVLISRKTVCAIMPRSSSQHTLLEVTSKQHYILVSQFLTKTHGPGELQKKIQHPLISVRSYCPNNSWTTVRTRGNHIGVSYSPLSSEQSTLVACLVEEDQTEPQPPCHMAALDSRFPSIQDTQSVTYYRLLDVDWSVSEWVVS